jgi:two-component system C4-dicarboxylate transport sensor histidine kinase DctB
MTAVIFLIIATVSWLSNREIEKSLARARKSEAELKEERDMLEVRVIERTAALRKVEAEKIEQAYRFVEFGRLAGGIFHDLMNPLTALSLNIENIADKHTGQIGSLAEDVARAKQATVHMQKLMDSMRKHLSREGTREHFSLNGAIDDLVRVLMTYARSRQVSLSFEGTAEIGYHGDAVHFSQVMTNLVSNAIESYPQDSHESAQERSVEVRLSRNGENAKIEVIDRGSGIAEADLIKIFEPFFTTKAKSHGLGIGLSLTKRIIENEFKGSLSVKSKKGEGSTFVLQFPA